ncbi:hypothetical protein C8R43DRAFT_1035287 [Mycena crocata]|nr:hypothetical protein C8R43DRAFT_1035287 [Mycena crocata]
MSTKHVHWKLTTEEYAARDLPESRTTTPFLEVQPLPETPVRQIHPLPETLEIHPLLTPPYALQLDFSFPSDAFRRNPQLNDSLLAAHACTPPRTALCIRIAGGALTTSRGVEHDRKGEPVTVGDVLTTVQKTLRAYDNGAAPPAAEPYMRRRIETVNGYCADRDPELRAANIAAEQEGQGRFSDHLLGHTLFAGFTLDPEQPDHCWQLHLTIPERYA